MATLERLGIAIIEGEARFVDGFKKAIEAAEIVSFIEVQAAKKIRSDLDRSKENRTTQPPTSFAKDHNIETAKRLNSLREQIDKISGRK